MSAPSETASCFGATRYIVAAVLLSLTLMGCVNKWESEFRPAFDGRDVNKLKERVSESAAPPELEVVSRAKDQPMSAGPLYYALRHKNGFEYLGSSHNYGSCSKFGSALPFGKSIGADLVVFYGKYLGTESGTYTYTMPTTETVNQQGTVLVYDQYGNPYSGTYSGTSTVITNRNYTGTYEHPKCMEDVAFWVRAENILGIHFRPRNDGEMEETLGLPGKMIFAVTDNSPAFHAGIKSGDLLVSIDGETFADRDSYVDFVNSSVGKTVDVRVIRGRVPETFSIKLERFMFPEKRFKEGILHPRKESALK